MNRSYAIPAAIALTAHALLFVGSGKPPIPQPADKHVKKIDTPPKSPEEIIYQTVVKLIPDEPAVASNQGDETEDGGSIDPPPGTPDIPRFDLRNEGGVEQRRVRTDIGHGDKITSLRVRGSGVGEGNGLGTAAFTSDMLDKKPRTRFQKEPVYPHAMKNTGATGTVWVEFLVDEKGLVHDARVVKSTNSGFDDATLAAVSQWRFEPGKRKNIPVRFRMSIPIVFNLND